MAAQDILFIAGVVLVGIAVVFLGLAAYVFVTRNILDIIADLNGTKRAEALAQMAKENAKPRRRNKKTENGTTGLPSERMSSEELNSAKQVANQAAQSEASVDQAEPVADATTVMQDDSAPTSVLDEGAADVTTLLNQDKVADVVDATAGKQSARRGKVAETSIPESFHVVRKIVLTQSTEYITLEQGENYA